MATKKDFKVTEYAVAAKPTITQTQRFGPMTVTRINPLLWRTAFKMAERDPKRMIFQPDGIIVCATREHRNYLARELAKQGHRVQIPIGKE